jgi:hypothetical protein
MPRPLPLPIQRHSSLKKATSLKKEQDMLPATLTAAQAQSGYLLLYSTVNATCYSTARVVPYTELYRERTAAGIETPEERLQKASERAARPSVR